MRAHLIAQFATLSMMPDTTRLEELGKKSLPDLLDALGSASVGSVPGQDTVNFLQSLISVRTAEMISRQLAGTAESIGKSANAIREALTHAEQTGKATVENSSEWLINAIKGETETTANSAKQIGTEIAQLTSAMSATGRDLREAGNQSSRAASKLNNFTLLLGLGTFLLFIAACWQAWEAHRQADLLQGQLPSAQHHGAAASQSTTKDKVK